MARRSQAQIQFDAITLEGGILAPEWLARAAALEAPAQTPADYGVPKGLQLRDEIGRYWRIAEALWAELAAARAHPGHDTAAATRRFAEQLLRQVLGFADLAPGATRRVGDRAFPLTFEGHGGRVPVVVGAHDESLDAPAERHGDPEHGVRRRSAWGALQEYLNAADEVLWGITTNGLALRVGRDNASLTRPAWLEADLERIFTEQRFADFSVLWLVAHASRFGRAGQLGAAGEAAATAPAECPLERWRSEAQKSGTAARARMSGNVEQALRELGSGFLEHPANVALRAALKSGELTPQEYFNELLRLVYRMIFLLTVEERGILHAADVPADAVRLYAEGYGMRRLRDRALRHSAHDRHGDLWSGLRPVFAGLGRAGGEPALALPGLGGLFEPAQCPHLDATALENRRLLTAVFRLAWLKEGDALARVNWKDMGVEEFGSVYESLLELVPQVGADARTFRFAGEGENTGNERKTSGSYYTPDSLVQQLLETALEPVVADRMAARPGDPEGAILSITVVDPACGSGHFLLAAARRLAGHLARVRTGGAPGAAEYRHALRDVVTHCIHGVDLNPMALELARMALWLEAFTPDRALGFLDHHLVCGNALLGLLDFAPLKEGIPTEAFKPLTGDDRELARTLATLNRQARQALERDVASGQLALELGTKPLAEAFAELDALADDAIGGVEAKRSRYSELRAEAEASKLALAADCFVGAFLMSKQLGPGERTLTERQAGERFPTTATLAMALDGTLASGYPAAVAAREACDASRVLHWPLTFPQVFAGGGFDVVLGNSPWEVSQLNEEEFFATRAPEIAALSGARRKAAIAALETDDPRIWRQYVEEKFRSESVNGSYRNDPRFELTAVGKINLYALFAESMYRMISADGRAGMVVPTGIATDDSTKAFFAQIAESGRLVSLYDFENREALFEGVHRSYKFSLLTLGRAPQAEFAFFATQVSQLADSRRRFRLTPDEFRLINPNTRTCPTFRSEYDAELTKRIYRRVPVLIDETKPAEEGNPWGLSFSQGLFNMTSDSGYFLAEPEPGALPLYEAKMIHQFDHRWATYAPDGQGGNASRDATDAEKADVNYSVRPRYWVAGHEVRERLEARGWTRGWLMGWRDITNATNERTVIASVIPRVGVGNNLPIMLMGDRPDARQAATLLGNLGALVFDFVGRHKVGGTHLNYFIYKQLPLLTPDAYPHDGLTFISTRVLELTYTACDLTAWARDLGHDGPPFRWDPDRRAMLRAELDAYYAHLYGLARDELRYILDPADVMGPDYPSETFRVLKKNEEHQYGEYRTRRLVLEAWDRLFGA